VVAFVCSEQSCAATIISVWVQLLLLRDVAGNKQPVQSMCKRGFYVEAVGGSGLGAQPPDADKGLIISTLKMAFKCTFHFDA